MRRLGVPPAEIEAAQAAAGQQTAQASPDLELWECHLPAFRLFAALRSQWRVLATPKQLWYQGLDYAVLPVVEERTGIQAGAEVFGHLQVMERAGRAWLNDS